MRISGLFLQNFRLYAQRHWLLDQPITLVIGPNAIGKTSIIEAVALLSTGDSFRASKIAETIRFEQELARVQGKILLEAQDGDGSQLESDEVQEKTLELTVTRGIVQGKRTHSRLFQVNGVKRRKKDFVGNLFSVVFRPEDMRLIEGSPPRRRAFLDTALSIFPEYAYSLKTYSEALKKRNKLLLAVREREMPASVLTFWNQQLVKHGQVLQSQRQRFLEFFASVEFSWNFSVRYLPSVISTNDTARRLQKEIMVGHTLIGPHKDDFAVFLQPNKSPAHESGNTNFEVSAYGSRGQQRMAVLWLKICELAFLHQKTGHKPVLLLDDILSELDHQSQQAVIELFPRYQSIITTTQPSVAELLSATKLGYEKIAL